MSEPPRPTGCFYPDAGQELLLRASFGGERDAIAAWNVWCAGNDLVETQHDNGSFRLLPLVYRNLTRHGFEDEQALRLKGIYRYFWSQNQQLFHEASRWIGELRAAGIPAMVLKGGAVSLLHYANPALRPMSDIDVLVPYAQAREAVDLLVRGGWRATSSWLREDLRYRHAMQMLDPAGREFDLHWHAYLECVEPTADDDLWRRSVPLHLGGVEVRAMSPTDTLLHTVVHGIRYNSESVIRWIPDALTILESARADIDWDLLLQQAERRRVRLRLETGLRYLRDAFGAAVPARALDGGRTTFVERFELRYTRLDAAGRRALFLGAYPFLFIGYLRFVAGMPLPRKLLELPEYLRYRFRLKKRHQVPLLVMRHVGAKLRKMTARSPNHGHA